MKKADIKIGNLYQVYTSYGRLEQQHWDTGGYQDIMIAKVLRADTAGVSTSEPITRHSRAISHPEIIDGNTVHVVDGPGWLVRSMTSPFDLSRSEPSGVLFSLESRRILRPWNQATAEQALANRIERDAAAKRAREAREALSALLKQDREYVLSITGPLEGGTPRMPHGWTSIRPDLSLSLNWAQIRRLVEAARASVQ